MKKTLFILIAILAFFTISASAANVGDKISEAVYSDITAYVNNHPMPCYVIDGYAVVVAEDLRNYCCDVYFDNDTRTLSITKSPGSAFTPPHVYRTTRETGEFYTDVLYTDIQTYVNNNWVKSFNVNGKTMIVIDEFGKYMDGYEWVEANRAAKAYMTDKPQAKFKIPESAVELVFEQYYDTYPPIAKAYNEYDLNFDGKADKIQVSVSSINAKNRYMKISINGKEKKLNTPYLLNLEAVYVCDVNPYDEYKDIAVLTVEESTVLRIFKADSSISEYKFKLDYGYGQPEITDFCYIGFINNPKFTTDHDGSVLIQTNFAATAGLIYKTYTLDEAGFLNNVIPSYYRVNYNPESIRNLPANISDHEFYMWENGYIKSETNFKDNGVIINKGEYFRVLYYNGNDYIYVEKENGHGGWIYLSENIHMLNPYYFHGID